MDSPPWAKLLVSLGVLAICLAASQIVLPTAVSISISDSGGTKAGLSLMALGARPLISGYVIVELAALLVPAWRPFRVGGPAGRAQLNQASLVVGLVLATMQAMIFAVGLARLDPTREFGVGFRLLSVVILLGATATLVVLARITNRSGLGSGFSILLLAEMVPQLAVPLGNSWGAAQAGIITVPALLNGALFVAVLVGATLWMFSRYYLPTPDVTHHPSLLSRPACGLVPLSIVAALLVMATNWSWSKHPAQFFGPQSPSYLPIALLLSIAAAVLFAFLFNRPDQVAKIWKRLLPEQPASVPPLKAVLLETVLFIVVIVLMETWAVRRLGPGYIAGGVPVLLTTGLLYDLAREWQAYRARPDLVPIWEIHQSYAVAPALRMLETEGIHAFARGRHLRALLQFFGPYIPVQLLVPAGQAQRARAIIQARWPDSETAAQQS